MINNSRTSKLVYGYLPDLETFAFADDTTAADEAREIEAIAAAGTFGAARKVEVRHVSYNPADPDCVSGDGHDDDEPFDVRQVGAVIAGDWPRMVADRSFTLLPEDLQAEFGTIADTTLNGDYLEIPVSAEHGIVAALRKRGYDVRRDDELVNVLDGATIRA
ncbi:hypothetical protein [Actinoplanes sp. NPDC020271]|uniref:hypothetical protein n=1 Tax=Actinoplanes sp. NPDC020271 TaxID=3363896 RepID=UPI003791F7B8